MIEHINIIEILSKQITALLDLMMCADEDCADIGSVKTASEMCLTMMTEMMQEVDKIFEEWKEKKQ